MLNAAVRYFDGASSGPPKALTEEKPKPLDNRPDPSLVAAASERLRRGFATLSVGTVAMSRPARCLT